MSQLLPALHRKDVERVKGSPCRTARTNESVFCGFFFRGLMGPAGPPTADPRDGMSTHSKLLQVCRPDEFFGPSNRCNVQTGDVHFWLSRCGIVIDPSPCTIDLPRGDNVYIPWRRVPPSQLPSRNNEPPREYRCLQNAANALPHYPGAEVMCGTLARRVAPGVLMSIYG